MISFLSNPYRFIYNLQNKQKAINQLIDLNKEIENRLSREQHILLNQYLPPYFKKEPIGIMFDYPTKNSKQIHQHLLYQLCRYTILQHLHNNISELHMRNTINVLLGVTDIYKIETEESEKYDIEYSDKKNNQTINPTIPVYKNDLSSKADLIFSPGFITEDNKEEVYALQAQLIIQKERDNQAPVPAKAPAKAPAKSIFNLSSINPFK
jgi:hypothetical protein